jgi:hypothetical protein
MFEAFRLAAAGLARLAATESAGRAIRRVSVAAALELLAALIVIAAIGCAAAGLWIWLRPAVGPVGAPFITALVLLLVAAILAGAGYLILRDRRPRRPAGGAARGGELGVAMEFAESAGRAGLGLLREHKGSLLLAALIGGLVLGSDTLARFRRERR